MIGQGQQTFNISLSNANATTAVTVGVDRTFGGDFIAIAGIAMQTEASLGKGVVVVKEARRLSADSVEVVLGATSMLSNVSVTVNVIAISM